jgi:type I restriction-modification system DNA methylase subunit
LVGAWRCRGRSSDRPGKAAGGAKARPLHPVTNANKTARASSTRGRPTNRAVAFFTHFYYYLRVNAAFEESRDAVARLVGVFEDVMRGRKALEFDEASTRASLIDPFWRALGWDVEDPREVVHEKRVATRKGTKRADYCFNVRGRPAFVVEAKEAGTKLTDPDAVFQAVRYGYNLPVPVAILTDFEEFRPFKSALEPTYENPARGLIKEFDLKYDQYLERWEDVHKTFSREAVYDGSLEKLVGTAVRNKEALDKKFFERLTAWREELARVIALDNGDVGVHDLNEAVQRILDRIIFVRVIEDREIEPVELLQDAVNRWAREKEKPLYQYVVDVFRKLDPQYNGELFDRHFSEQLLVRDRPLHDFVESLYYPLCPYQFNVIGVEMLGTIYERFLGSTIRLTPSHRAKVEEKPEVRKAGGVYYTPAYIVDYIVENTVGKLLDGCKTPRDVARLKILDPACGSGSFLLGAFRRLIEWHEDYYNRHPEKISRPPKAECWLDKEHPDGPRRRLTARAKGRILVNNIYGVDIDPQAVEVTVMSLYLKVLEDVDAGLLMKTALLPPLDGNVKCGNSLIGSDYWDFVRAEQGELFERTEAEERRVNPFDWDQEFGDIIKYKPGTRDLAAGSGFDAVIGNPPYVLIGRDRPEEQMYFTSGRYSLTAYKINTYILFIERGLKLLGKEGATLGFIVPKSIVFNTYFSATREILLSDYAVRRIVEISDKVFAGAEVGDSVLFFCAISDDPLNDYVNYIKADNIYPEMRIIGSYKTQQKVLLEDPYYRFYTSPIRLKVTTKKLGDISDVTNGLNQGNVRHILISDTKESETHQKLILGKDVKRYSLNWSGSWVNYDRMLKGKLKPSDTQSKRGMTPQTKVDFALRDPRIYEPKKILVRKTADHIIAVYDEYGYYYDSLAYGVRLASNSKLSTLYVLGILNSKLLDYIHSSIALNVGKVFAKVLAKNLKVLPIRPIDFSDPADVEKHDDMVRLVDEMLDLHKRLAAAKSDADRTRLKRAVKTTDRKIDALVYELYGLTDEEIRVMEGANRG